MKIACLINSHNYADYIGEAVASTLDQTHPFDEIVVVDDGSTDGTLDLLHREFGHHPTLKVIAKEQAGQLSCFNVGIDQVTSDLVCFLDADDRYRREYAATAVDFYQAHPDIDFLSVNCKVLGDYARRRQHHRVTRDRGISLISTILRRAWVGMPTSCLSMRTRSARLVLPFPFESTWQTRADDVLIFGTSLVGAHKYHLHEPLVEYRVHGNNHFAGRKINATDKLRYWLRVNQLITWFVKREGYDVDSLSFLLDREFRTWERPTTKEMFHYLGMSMTSRLPFLKRVEQMAIIVGHRVREHVRRRPHSTSPALLGSDERCEQPDAPARAA